MSPGFISGRSASGPLDDRCFLCVRRSEVATITLYVNRGLGTIGAPIRLGVPPEITLLTLRRA